MARTNSLGKGLGAMFPDLMNNAGERPAFIMCGIEELTPNRFQPRSDFNDVAQQELMTSIKQNGVIQPIIVRKAQNGYEIVAGERRWRAAQASGIKEVPVIIRKASDRELAELSLIENIQREALNPIEEAKAYKVLAGDFALSQDDISTRVGKDRSTIANTIRLLKLPEEIQKDVISKKITAGHARALLSLDVPELQLNALRIIKKRELNVRETEGLITRLKSSQGKNEKKSPDKYIDDIQKTLSSHLLTRVKIKSGKKAGFIEIKYANPSELDRLTRYLLER